MKPEQISPPVIHDKNSPTQSFSSNETATSRDMKTFPYDSDMIVIPDDIGMLSSERKTDSNGVTLCEWRTGLFDCFRFNISHGILAALVPCIPVGQIAHRVGMGRFAIVLLVAGILYTTSFGCSFFMTPTMNITAAVSSLVFITLLTTIRQRIRKLFMIPGSIVMDICTVFWCGCCAIAQMSAHVESVKPGSCSIIPRDVLPGYK